MTDNDIHLDVRIAREPSLVARDRRRFARIREPTSVLSGGTGQPIHEFGGGLDMRHGKAKPRSEDENHQPRPTQLAAIILDMSGLLYTKSVAGLSEDQKCLYLAKNMAIAQDAIVAGNLKVPMKKAMSTYADPHIISEFVHFVDDWQHKTAVLCDRGTLRESSFFFTGLVWKAGCMPFVNMRDVTRPEPLAPQGAQHLILATLGLPELQRAKEGIANIHVNAGLRRRVGGLRPLREFDVDGEECICLSLPFSTKPEHVMKHEKVVPLPDVLDPRGVVASFAQRRGNVITNRNLLDVFLAEPKGEAGLFEPLQTSPEVLRPGQVVRVEVVFRIVPAGNDSALRMDVKSVLIINTKVAESIAYAEFKEKQVELSAQRDTFSLGGPGPSGTVIQPHGGFNKAGQHSTSAQDDDDDMKEDLLPVLFESPSMIVYSKKGKGKAASPEMSPVVAFAK
ncbi:hypothetical protein PENSPDRAFT_671096 [Peniophora sp. CONT]|nr:hypothetical protein PENSPDRAFT_671096 [Peniophora sp. CONT]